MRGSFRMRAAARSSVRSLYTAPQWAGELSTRAAEDASKAVSYDIKIHDSFLWEPARFSFAEDAWPTDLPMHVRRALCNGNVDQEYVCIGEAFTFPDSADNPVVNDPSHPARLWWDPTSSSARLLVQLGPHFPPGLWIPLKPEYDALKRLFSDCTSLDAIHMERYLPVFEKLQRAAEDKAGGSLIEQHQKEGGVHKASSDQYRAQLRQGTVRSLYRDYDNTVTVYLGTCVHPLRTEMQLSAKVKTDPVNPFVFAWPLLQIEGGEQEDWQRRRMHSCFRTVYSKSLIVLESRMDLLPDADSPDLPALASEGEVPLFARINFPSYVRLAGGPSLRRKVNAGLGTEFPENLPVDVIAALSSFAVAGPNTIGGRLDEELAAIPAAGGKSERRRLSFAAGANAVALAAVSPEAFTQRFDALAGSDMPLVRLSAFIGAHDVGDNDARDRVEAAEPDSSTREAMANYRKNAGGPSDHALSEHTAETASKVVNPYMTA